MMHREMNEYVNRIINLYTKSEVEGPAKDAFHRWLTDDELASEKEAGLLRIWNKTKSAVTADTMNSLTTVKFKSRFGAEKKDIRLMLWRYAAAIILVISISSAYIFTKNASSETNIIEYYSQAGHLETITLPDGSIVHTNSGTVILYAENFGKDNRNLYLSGEANFKVQKNADIPFVVKAKDFTVTALGTEFDVSSYPEDPYFKTTLIEGSVKVKQNNSLTDYILNVSDRFVYSKHTGESSVTQANLHEETAWQRGELVFRGVTMKEILNILERKYAVSFQFKANVFNDDKFNFRFKKEATLPEVIDIIKEVSTDFDYQKTGGSYYITSKN